LLFYKTSGKIKNDFEKLEIRKELPPKQRGSSLKEKKLSS